MMSIQKLALTCPLVCFVDTYEPVSFVGVGDFLFLIPSTAQAACPQVHHAASPEIVGLGRKMPHDGNMPTT